MSTPHASRKQTRRRMRRYGVAWVAFLLAGVIALPSQVLAGPASEPQHYASPVGGISLEQAADKVRRQTGGRVLSATPVEKGGRRGYNIRVLVDGKRVKEYYVDADGRMSSR